MILSVSASKKILQVMILAVCLVYTQAIGFDFVWDDNMFLVDSTQFRSENWYSIFTEPFFVSDNYYRPLVLLTYFVDGRLSEFDPGVMHATNLFFFYANIILVGYVTRLLISRISTIDPRQAVLAPYLASLIYAVHPANIESAAWISGRFDLMVTFFVLLAFCAECLRGTSIFRYAMLFLMYLLAALSKEMAVTFPLLLVMWHLLLADYSKPINVRWIKIFVLEHWLSYAVVVAAGFSYLVIRFLALGYLLREPPLQYMGDQLQHVLLVAKAFGMYLFSTLLPFAYSSPLHKEYFPINHDDRFAWVSLLIILLSMIYVALAFKKRSTISLLYLMFCASLLPVLHIKAVPIDENIIQERFLTLPLVFMSMLMSLLVVFIFHSNDFSILVKKVMLAVFGFWIFVNCLAVNNQLPMWKNNLYFWSWAREKAPDSVVANGNLAATLYSLRELDKAEYYALLAYNLEEGRLGGTVGLANIYLDKGEPRKAKKYIDRLLNSPRYLRSSELKEALNTLGLIYLRTGHYSKAQEIFSDLLSEDPYYVQAMVNLGTTQYCAGLKDEGQKLWRQSLNLLHAERRRMFSTHFEKMIEDNVECEVMNIDLE